jgi:hypothetical protein
VCRKDGAATARARKGTTPNTVPKKTNIAPRRCRWSGSQRALTASAPTPNAM